VDSKQAKRYCNWVGGTFSVKERGVGITLPEGREEGLVEDNIKEY